MAVGAPVAAAGEGRGLWQVQGGGSQGAGGRRGGRRGLRSRDLRGEVVRVQLDGLPGSAEVGLGAPDWDEGAGPLAAEAEPRELARDSCGRGSGRQGTRALGPEAVRADEVRVVKAHQGRERWTPWLRDRAPAREGIAGRLSAAPRGRTGAPLGRGRCSSGAGAGSAEASLRDVCAGNAAAQSCCAAARMRHLGAAVAPRPERPSPFSQVQCSSEQWNKRLRPRARPGSNPEHLARVMNARGIRCAGRLRVGSVEVSHRRGCSFAGLIQPVARRASRGAAAGKLSLRG